MPNDFAPITPAGAAALLSSAQLGTVTAPIAATVIPAVEATAVTTAAPAIDPVAAAPLAAAPAPALVAATPAPTPSAVVDLAAVRNQATAEANQRASDITALCVGFGFPNEAAGFIASTKTLGEMTRELQAKKAASADPATSSLAGGGKPPGDAKAWDEVISKLK